MNIDHSDFVGFNNYESLSNSKNDVDVNMQNFTNEANDFGERQFFYFPPDTPSQRSLMDIDLPKKPNIFEITTMACFPCCLGGCTTDSKQEYKRAFKTICLFVSAIQVIMFLVSIGIGGFTSLTTNWLLGPDYCTFIEVGAKYGFAIKENYEIYRYITPIFLHSGALQLLINLFAQLRMGLYLERRWGWLKFTSMFFISSIAGVVLSCCIRPNQIGVAASASVMGMMGGYLAQLNLTWHKLEGWQKRINLSLCVLIILITFATGIGPNYVDSIANLGALIMGMALGYSIFGREYARQNSKLAASISFFAALFVILYFILGIAVFFIIIPVKEATPCPP